MKKMFVIYLCGSVVYMAGCKNDRTDETRADTTVVTVPLTTPTPSQDTKQAVVDSPVAAKKVDVPVDKKPAVPAVKKDKAEKDTASMVRLKKVSRKGRIILALLQQDMQVKIEADKDGIYNRAETMPLYPGGEAALREFIENRIEYPENAMDNGIQGTVKVSFAIDEQGKIYSPAIISPKLGYGLEEEAIRIVKRMPKWTPGQVNGQNVKTRFTLPITYRIE
jgi:protein TonB